MKNIKYYQQIYGALGVFYEVLESYLLLEAQGKKTEQETIEAIESYIKSNTRSTLPPDFLIQELHRSDALFINISDYDIQWVADQNEVKHFDLEEVKDRLAEMLPSEQEINEWITNCLV